MLRLQVATVSDIAQWLESVLEVVDLAVDDPLHALAQGDRGEAVWEKNELLED